MAACAGGADRMLARKRFAIRALVDIACLVVVSAPVLVVNVAAQPFHRGFFCDDQSLMHPFKGDTVPTWLLCLFGFGLPLVSMMVVECLLQKSTRCCVLVPTELPRAPKSCAESMYRATITFFFGAAITQLLTEMGKYSIGRLRPHFLTVCRPEHVPSNCSGLFITENLCTDDYNEQVMKQARLSFPSGHASMSMYSAVFLILYLQRRQVCGQGRLVRPVVQVVVLCLAFYTCLSRVSDYKHHWSDVLAGALLGATVCCVIMACLHDYHQLSARRPGSVLPGSRKERLPMYRQDNTSTSSDDPPSIPLPTVHDTVQVHVENEKM